MKRLTLIVVAAAALVFSAPAFAQRSHASPGGGPPAGAGGASSAHGPGMSGSHDAGAANSDISHASPATVLSHNTAMADKIKTLTGQDATTACNGFKNLGQCVAAAHVAKNLSIPAGFDALSPEEDLRGLVRENLLFHNTILDVAGSARLAAMVRKVIELPLVYNSYRWYSAEQMGISAHYHRQIVKALADGDADRAELIMKEHLFEARDLLVAEVRAIEAQSAEAPQ